MKPLKQRNRHDPDNGVWGDCHRACLASLFELDLDDVPNFGDGGPDGNEFNRRVNEWLSGRGLVQFSVAYQADLDAILVAMKSMNPGVYYILGGRSKTGVDHSVIGLDDRIVHDPSINDSGIVGPCVNDGLFWITFFGPSVLKAAKRRSS